MSLRWRTGWVTRSGSSQLISQRRKWKDLRKSTTKGWKGRRGGRRQRRGRGGSGRKRGRRRCGWRRRRREEGEREGVGSKPLSDDCRPFILPKIWLVNNLFLKLMDKVFNKLWDCFQIPDHIPIRMVGKHKKCYSGQITDVNFYVSIFTAGLRLPLTVLYHQLLGYLGVSVSQIYPNVWRVFIGEKVIWGQMSGRHY